MSAAHKISTALPAGPETGAYERHLSPAHVAEMWGLSVDTVRRLFQNEPGVLVIGSETKGRGKRSYKTLRIPEHVVERVHRKLSKV